MPKPLNFATREQLTDLLLERLTVEGFTSSWVKVLLVLIIFYHVNTRLLSKCYKTRYDMGLQQESSSFINTLLIIK